MEESTPFFYYRFLNRDRELFPKFCHREESLGRRDDLTRQQGDGFFASLIAMTKELFYEISSNISFLDQVPTLIYKNPMIIFGLDG